ncbi:MAG: primosomal protein N', partial [Armatimonadota bacterium]
EIVSAIEAGSHERFLLHGVTGSGKTEVYLHCIRQALDQGKNAIVLVPEISLTPQMVGRFKARFGDTLALQHSALGAGERFDEWFRAKQGKARIVIGARSAIFAPLQNIGVIIIDEEYDAAYKQDSSPRYHAVEVATRRAKAHNAVLVMGSATPSIERFYAAKTGPDTRLLTLPERIDSRPMPDVKIIDLCKEPKTDVETVFSQDLLTQLDRRLADGEQSMLFLNRRGYSTFVICKECGASPRCPNCAVSLTYHFGDRLLKCHHCGFERKVPDMCETCESRDIGFLGVGTERVTDQIQRQFPDARILRMDRDTTGTKGAYDRILRQFGEGDADILVGTQMIASGHDFPNLTLVGVLNADTGLHRPDFRSSERTFQLITQIAGRPGRAEKPGEVVVQTYNADHYAIRAAARHDYLGFYAIELESRRENLYPPFISLVRLVISSEDQKQGFSTVKHLAVALKQAGVYDSIAGEQEADRIQLLGPAQCPLYKLRGRYRFSILLKGPDSTQLAQTAAGVLGGFDLPEAVWVTADVNPTNMM